MSSVAPYPAWRIGGGRSLPLDRGVLIAGIINVTPDSFSDGGLLAEPNSAVAHGLSLAGAGADILDIGGESTRPGSRPVDPAEQIRRVLPVISRLAERCPAAISIDTRSAEVAATALDRGARIVNDVSALRDDPRMAPLVAGRGAGVVLMHMQGSPGTMQDNPRYGDVVAEVRDFLDRRVRFACEAGIGREQIAIDPGIGFGKTLGHNLQLLAGVDRLVELGLPVMVGPSRKRFIGELAGPEGGWPGGEGAQVSGDDSRLAGTIAACILAVAGGARIVRVHSPGPVRQALRVAEAIRAARPPA